MRRVRVKVCGITRPGDARGLAALGVDAIGFNFCAGTPRAVSPSLARELGRLLPSFVVRVGVFRDQDGAEVDRIAAEAGLDRLQLHGAEDAEFIAGRRLPVLKVVWPGPGWTPDAIASFRGRPILVDARHPGLPGGTGLVADWEAARGLVAAGWEVTLAGGLGLETIEAAVRRVRPAAVDLNSAVETAPGVKDLTRVAGVLERLSALQDPDPGPVEAA